nr:flagellar protein FlaG [Aestuariibacter sp. A3R04]
MAELQASSPLRNTRTENGAGDVASGQIDSASAKENVQGSTAPADNPIREVQNLDDVEVAAREVEAFLQVQNRNLAFSVDEETKRSVVTVKDSESGDVIRQIPSDEVLRLAERIKNLQEDVGSSVGVLVNNQV